MTQRKEAFKDIKKRKKEKNLNNLLTTLQEMSADLYSVKNQKAQTGHSEETHQHFHIWLKMVRMQ